MKIKRKEKLLDGKSFKEMKILFAENKTSLGEEIRLHPKERNKTSPSNKENIQGIEYCATGNNYLISEHSSPFEENDWASGKNSSQK